MDITNATATQPYLVIRDQESVDRPINPGYMRPTPGNLPYTCWRAEAFTSRGGAKATDTIVAEHATWSAARADADARNREFSDETHARLSALLAR